MAFYLSEIKNVILYGGGKNTKKYYSFFTELGYPIQMIVDNDARNLKNDFPCKVYQKEEVSWLEIENVLIVICLQNGLKHDEIAETLYSLGQNQLLFLPTKSDYYLQAEMQECYHKFLERVMTKDIKIPHYSEMIEGKYLSNILQDDKDMLTCWVEKEYIHSSIKKGQEVLDYYLERNIACLIPYVILFQYIMGIEKYPKEYLEIYRPNDIIKQKELLKDRNVLWNVYEENMNRNPSYYIQAPATAAWNRDGHFNIDDGHHRVIYLMLKGWYEFPLRISKLDYEKFMEFRKGKEWITIDRKVRVKWGELASNLSRWIIERKILVGKILDLSNTSGYIFWWLQKNFKIDFMLPGTQERYDILLLFQSKQLSELNIKASEFKIIVAEECFEIEDTYQNYEKCAEIFKGYINEQYTTINIYMRNKNG